MKNIHQIKVETLDEFYRELNISLIKSGINIDDEDYEYETDWTTVMVEIDTIIDNIKKEMIKKAN